MSILIKGIPLGGYEISIMKDGERYRARVDGIWCEVEEIPTTDTDSDTISRQAAITALSNEIVKRRLLDEMYDGCIDEFQTEEILKKLPPAQPAPSQVAADIARIVENGQDMRVIGQPERIKGHWIESNGLNILMKKFIEKGETWRMCDKCGAGFMVGYQYECDKLYHETFHNFCPKCGADMREVTE